MTTTTAPPKGYWMDASGHLIPESKVKPIDQLRNQVVYDLCRMAEAQSQGLAKFKIDAMTEVGSFCALSLDQYGVKTGGDKGNITLVSFDGQYKVVRQMQDKITFSEQLMAAKALIDACVHHWAQDASDNIKVLVNHAFQTDKEGKINTGRVLSLRRLDIVDDKWTLAMQAIADSMQVASTKPYVRFYKRNEKTMEYMPIVLDVAGV
ncbi:DUF3164 family protein [Rhodoferax aquaticus]|uniref:DUF3164 family protein n=1 Tax=Rhodoferax aquaticus TaxID=2527691 RepID=A0A515ERS1_9BURK|nr:DUF3164 family protein [Rhodoferax aquaticus]QDL55313.1 DUF3164 family protein [Rhodoferax aquaticus]